MNNNSVEEDHQDDLQDFTVLDHLKYRGKQRPATSGDGLPQNGSVDTPRPVRRVRSEGNDQNAATSVQPDVQILDPKPRVSGSQSIGPESDYERLDGDSHAHRHHDNNHHDNHHRHDHDDHDHRGHDWDNEELNYVVPENEIEAHRMHNNYLFGFKKWKSHVTQRPIESRSDVVRSLYGDDEKTLPVKVSTLRPTNFLYVVLFGWWLALIYAILSFLMFITVVGRDYSHLCIKLAKFFFWPFGKFVHQIHAAPLHSVASIPLVSTPEHDSSTESTPLQPRRGEKKNRCGGCTCTCSKTFWRRADSYIWMVLGIPLLIVVHSIVFFITWLLVVTIPIAKLNLKTITKLIYLPPEQIDVGDSGQVTLDLNQLHSEILMYTHQSVNCYYYKYTLDGMNVILVNLLIFVVLALALGYGDHGNHITGPVTKFVMASLAIIPLTYYIGLSIASISAQSVLAVGAVLNATFGSLVEITLYVIMLIKGIETGDTCYVAFVKTSMTGTLLVTILFIPGICMLIGGAKFSTQVFNPRTAAVSASLLFVAVVGSFSPSLFAGIFGTLSCAKCEKYVHMTNITDGIMNTTVYNTTGLQCSNCHRSIFGLDNDMTLYNDHILPLVYALAIILPVSYIIGLVFTLKTHTSHLYDQFNAENEPSFGAHGSAQWGRVKCIVILMISALLISLCAEIVTENIQPLLAKSGISEYFIGVTLLAIIPDLPEVVNGIQFALQDNVSLGIEVGSSTAVQVCLVQIPLMILITLIHPALNFTLLFDTIHLFTVFFSVLLINYVFLDGKSNYFQGSILVTVYVIMMVMYFFSPVPKEARCNHDPN